nr:voltage-dependent calcium channel subunit alpha-2/delta-3-like [Leptinotarsa decemlineata]
MHELYIGEKRVTCVAVSETVNRGCPQGSSLGPTPWLLVMEAWFGRINSMKTRQGIGAVGVPVPAYGDDQLVIIEGNSGDSIEDRWKLVWSEYEAWKEEMWLSNNERKTECMFIPTSKDERLPALSMHGRMIEQKTRVRYLGIVVDTGLLFIDSGQSGEFGDLHPRAINEKWYKSAVLQHQYDESFVYSVPFDAGQIDDPMVTGSFAIFPSDGGFEAPGSVVGFQFSQRDLQTQFKKVSNKLTNQCSHCSRCNDSLDCYIIDSSGYIIVSENEWDTGRFFGEIEGDIFESMVVEDIYRNVTLYDYQALCKRDTENSSSSSPDLLITPMRNIQTFVNWILTKMLYFILEMSFYKLHETVTYAQDFMQNNTDDIDVGEAEESVQFNNSADNYYACETQLNLFVLRQDIFIEGSFNGEVDYKRNYYVKRIPNSNLIFVAINNTLIEENKRIISTDPVAITLEPEFEYWSINTTLLPCQKLNLNNLSRRRLTGCYNEHPLEHEIIDCGRASLLRENLILVFLTMIFVLRN